MLQRKDKETVDIDPKRDQDTSVFFVMFTEGRKKGKPGRMQSQGGNVTSFISKWSRLME